MRLIKTMIVTIPKQKEIKAMDISGIFDAMAKYANQILAYKRYRKFLSIRDKAVKAFYASYSPRYYKRKYSLRYMAYPNVEDDEFYFELGADVPGYSAWHRVNSDYLYDLVFKEGFHGGATGGPEHPRSGVPLWRYPHPEYTSWGRAATRGPSPYYHIMAEWNSYMNGEDKAVKKTAITEAMRPFIPRLREYLMSMREG